MKTYKSTLTKGYCAYWEKSKSVIELVSNAVDSEGEFSYKLNKETGEILLHNDGVTVSNRALLLGLSDK